MRDDTNDDIAKRIAQLDNRLPIWSSFRTQNTNKNNTSMVRRIRDDACSTTTTTTTTTLAVVVVGAAAVATVVSYAAYELHRSIIREYGWEGTLRYLWEGDPYEPLLREYVDVLQDFEMKVVPIQSQLQGLEDTLAIATATASTPTTVAPVESIVATTSSSSSSLTGTNTNINTNTLYIWNQKWMEHPSNATNTTTNLNVERSLADLNYNLDKNCTFIDGIILSSSSSPSPSSYSSSLNSSSSSAGATLPSNKDNNQFLCEKIKQRKKNYSNCTYLNMKREESTKFIIIIIIPKRTTWCL